MDLKKYEGVRVWNEFMRQRQGPLAGCCKQVHESSCQTGISSAAERKTATEDVAHLCSMELAEQTWVCRRLEEEMTSHLQTDLTAQFKYTTRTNSGMLKNYYYYYHHNHPHHPHPSL